MNFFVYVITNKINGRQYVGQTVNPKTRWKSHRALALMINAKFNRYRRPLYDAMRKYGRDNFVFSVLMIVDSLKLANEAEKTLISLLKTSRGGGYNATDGGDGTPGRRHTESEIRKLKLSNTGRKHSEEAKAGMRVVQRERSRQSGKVFEYAGETLTIPEWCEKLLISTQVLYNRIRKGMSFSEAVLWKPKPKLIEIGGQLKTITEWAKYSGVGRCVIKSRILSGKPESEWLSPVAPNFHFITFNGMTKSISQWSKLTGISQKSISFRLRSGWSEKDALTIPNLPGGFKLKLLRESRQKAKLLKSIDLLNNNAIIPKHIQ